MAAKTKKKAVAKTKKKTVTVKKKKTAAKTKSKATKSKIKKGARYQCSVCGVAVSIDEVCGCMDVCDIVCCGEQMKPKKK